MLNYVTNLNCLSCLHLTKCKSNVKKLIKLGL